MVKRRRKESSQSSASEKEPHTYHSEDKDENSSTTTHSKVIRLARKNNSPAVITCNFLPNCSRRAFNTFAQFESHYAQVHTHRCMECHRNFPSERYLGIHITENHDVFAELKKERGEKIYACFVEDCDRLCRTPQKRRLHVIDKHGFPKDFYFRVVDHGIDNCTSLLRKPRRYSPGDGRSGGDTESKGQSESSDEMPTTMPTTSNIKVLSDAATVRDVKTIHQELTKENRDGVREEENNAYRSKSLNSVTDRGGADELADMMAAVKLVPPSVRFGRRVGRKVGLGRN